jgi:site-specific DNA-methyltransferase (adenine-specific)
MNNKIICGDALSELEKMSSNSVDLIITSPPYFGQREYGSLLNPKEVGRESNIDDYLHHLLQIFQECKRVCKYTGNIVFNIGDVYIKKCLQLLPFKFASMVMNLYEDILLVNTITWVKTNPTPRQYKKRLIPSTEPFFHFAKNDHYYFDMDSYFKKSKDTNGEPGKKFFSKGKKYLSMIESSSLTIIEKENAKRDVEIALKEVRSGVISDFRMKIRGMHKRAFGGQSGGRNNQIDKKGYTVIRMRGEALKRDVIEHSVAMTKNIDHIAVFPLTIVQELIQLLSKEGDVVLDPFCGSGQVCLAALQLNRKYIGIDLYQKYCDIALNRIQDFKQRKPYDYFEENRDIL